MRIIYYHSHNAVFMYLFRASGAARRFIFKSQRRRVIYKILTLFIGEIKWSRGQSAVWAYNYIRWCDFRRGTHVKATYSQEMIAPHFFYHHYSTESTRYYKLSALGHGKTARFLVMYAHGPRRTDRRHLPEWSYEKKWTRCRHNDTLFTEINFTRSCVRVIWCVYEWWADFECFHSRRAEELRPVSRIASSDIL
jgi:hypothetical protein